MAVFVGLAGWNVHFKMFLPAISIYLKRKKKQEYETNKSNVVVVFALIQTHKPNYEKRNKEMVKLTPGEKKNCKRQEEKNERNRRR